jgi:heptosyltransferase-2
MANRSTKILIIRFSSLGDLVLLTSLLQAVRDGIPDAEIHLLCKERYAGLFAGDDRVNRLFTLGTGGPLELFGLIFRLRSERYDAVLDAHNVFRSNLIYRIVHAPRKIQIRKEHFKKALLIARKRNLYDSVSGLTERYLACAREFGIEAPEPPPRIVIPPAAEAQAAAVLDGAGLANRPLIAVAPGARWETKRYPEEGFRAIVSGLPDGGFGIAMVGNEDDAEMISRIIDGCHRTAVNLAGRLTILETAAVLQRAEVTVTNDSAPLHISEAVGTPVVALFGPTVREFGYYPRLAASIALETEIGCRPCSRNGAKPCPEGTKQCLTAIQPETILEAVRSVMAGMGRSVPAHKRLPEAPHDP